MRAPSSSVLFGCTLLTLASCAERPPEPLPIDVAAHRGEVDAWHARRVGELEAPDSWLSLIGLHWLDDAETTMGADPDNGIVLPSDKGAAGRVGTFVVTREEDGAAAPPERARAQVVFRTAPGAVVTQGVDSTINLSAGTGPRPPDVSGDPAVTEAVMTEDVGRGNYRVLRHGPLNWIVVRRGDRVAVRLRDNDDPTYTDFRGIERYPVDPAWRVTARWVPHEKTVAVPNVLGTVSEQASPAHLAFEVDGTRHTLDVTGDPDDERFMLVFADGTSGEDTYGGGRYVWVDRPDAQGRVALDFNFAYNPPCVFSEFATCPLPSRDNRLDVAIRAGEKDWRH